MQYVVGRTEIEGLVDLGDRDDHRRREDSTAGELLTGRIGAGKVDDR